MYKCTVQCVQVYSVGEAGGRVEASSVVQWSHEAGDSDWFYLCSLYSITTASERQVLQVGS